MYAAARSAAIFFLRLKAFRNPRALRTSCFPSDGGGMAAECDSATSGARRGGEVGALGGEAAACTAGIASIRVFLRCCCCLFLLLPQKLFCSAETTTFPRLFPIPMLLTGRARIWDFLRFRFDLLFFLALIDEYRA